MLQNWTAARDNHEQTIIAPPKPRTITYIYIIFLRLTQLNISLTIVDYREQMGSPQQEHPVIVFFSFLMPLMTFPSKKVNLLNLIH